MNHRFSVIVALVAAALLLAVPLPARAQGAQSLVGTTPTLVIGTLDGGTFDLSAQRGKWVVVNWWATWCTPCIKEIPDLNALASRDDVEVLGLDFEEIERADLDAFLAEHPIEYPVAPVDVYEPLEGFPVPRGLPLTYVVAPDGVVAQAFIGPVTRADIEAVMKAGAVTIKDPAPVR